MTNDERVTELQTRMSEMVNASRARMVRAFHQSSSRSMRWAGRCS